MAPSNPQAARSEATPASRACRRCHMQTSISDSTPDKQSRTNPLSLRRDSSTRQETRPQGLTTLAMLQTAPPWSAYVSHQLCVHHFSSSTILITLSFIRHAGLPPAKNKTNHIYKLTLLVILCSEAYT